MSAYVVSDKTITAIVQGFQRMDFQTSIVDCDTKEEYYARSNPNAIGQILLNQNYKSVNYRYSEDTEPRKFAMAYKTDEHGYREDYTLGEIYGCVNCYMYQSCENPEWVESEIYNSLIALKNDLTDKAFEKLGEKICWGI